MVQCVNCNTQFEFQKGQIDLTQKDDNQKVLSYEACINFFENRFNCIQCKTEQCKNCKVTPYHKGFTCEQYSLTQKNKCRFCLLPNCKDKECLQKMQNSCKKMLKCGHMCSGFDGEISCPSCLTCDKA